MEIKNVMIAGGGVLGSQIVYQVAYSGFNATLYDVSDDTLSTAKSRLKKLGEHYQKDIGISKEQAIDIVNKITYTTSLKESSESADLVIEAIPEKIDIKESFYKELNEHAPAHTIFATSTSTLRPSEFMEATGRPDRFTTLHFANEIWKHNTGEVMRTEKTSDETFNKVLQFAKDIGLVALPIHKEHPHYILNSLLLPWLSAGSYLLANNIADVNTIDKAWSKAIGDHFGPFGMIDSVGLNTVYNILEGRLTDDVDKDDWRYKYLNILEKRIDEGCTGKSAGKGFYDYPNPAFEQDDFFENSDDIQKLEHNYKNVTVAGGGVLGSQIAYQTAASGFNISLYDINDDAVKAAKGRIDNIVSEYAEDMNVNKTKAQEFADHIQYYSDIAAATKDADIIIEVVPESVKIKTSFYKDLREVLPEKTNILTNTSTLPPSEFMDETGRPEQFAALHFANHIWTNNTGEVMATSKTSKEVFNKALAFARDLHLVVLPIYKEQPGYITNALLPPLLTNSQRLLAEGVADVETIDKTWMIATGAQKGPFALLDQVGLNTAKNILENIAEESGNEIDKKALENLVKLIDAGKTGLDSGEGFYDYSNGIPYEAPDFLK